MFVIRSVSSGDLPFLWSMLWEAAAVAEEVRGLGKDAGLALPDIRRYLEGWGREGDVGVIALNEVKEPLGAAWLRLFSKESPGYGFVAVDIPELSIGVGASHRVQGVGGVLIDALIATARSYGYRGVSLAVDRRNPARALYERKGFRDAGTSGSASSGLTMIAWL